jgi:hypothetical protein
LGFGGLPKARQFAKRSRHISVIRSSSNCLEEVFSETRIRLAA